MQRPVWGTLCGVVVCSVLLSVISAWSYIKGNEAARDTAEYREQLISRRRPPKPERVIPRIGGPPN